MLELLLLLLQTLHHGQMKLSQQTALHVQI
jgi:hypothetical protein